MNYKDIDSLICLEAENRDTGKSQILVSPLSFSETLLWYNNLNNKHTENSIFAFNEGLNTRLTEYGDSRTIKDYIYNTLSDEDIKKPMILCSVDLQKEE